MTAQEDSAELRDVEILVPGANCPWCFNEALEEIGRLPGVDEVHSSIREGWIWVRHAEVPTSVLVDTLREHLHGTDDSSHECQMVAVEPQPVEGTGGRA